MPIGKKCLPFPQARSLQFGKEIDLRVNLFKAIAVNNSVSIAVYVHNYFF